MEAVCLTDSVVLFAMILPSHFCIQNMLAATVSLLEWKYRTGRLFDFENLDETVD
jgi:hypothetical protein